MGIMDSVHQIRYHLLNESCAQMLKYTNHLQFITLHERNIINLMEFASVFEYTHYKANIHFIKYTNTGPGLLSLIIKHACM